MSARGIKSGRNYEEVEFLFVSPSFFCQGTQEKKSTSIADATPDLFPEEKKRDLKTGWGWVIQSEEETQKMLDDFHVPTKEKLVEMSQWLQLNDAGKVVRYKELPFFPKKEG